MKIAVLFNRVTSHFAREQDILADEDTIETAKDIAQVLKGLGHQIMLFEVSQKTLSRLPTLKADFLFNNAFGIGNLPKTEGRLAGILEESGIPFSGSKRQAIDLTTDKVATKKLLGRKGLPTPKYQVFSNGETFDRYLKFPLIVKPAAEDCSLGINGHSVVGEKKELDGQVTLLEKIYHEPVLVEEYIAGRELNVTVLGNGKNAKVLPISEIIFGPSFAHKYKVVDFAAKWQKQSSAYKDTVGSCPAKLEERERKKIEEISLAAFLLTGCRDYARVDIRLSKEGVPFVLEVNANPGVGPDDGATRSALTAGYSYPQFLTEIVKIAFLR